MRLLTRDIPLQHNTVVALGFFDGVHIAHAKLIREARETALRSGGKLLVYTFDKNPREVLRPTDAPPMLTPIETRVSLLAQNGADIIVIRHFDEEFAMIEPRLFIRMLAQMYHPSDIFVGYNYTFGAKGRGKPATLKKYAAEYGYDVHVMEQLSCDAGGVSSTRIRQAVVRGDLDVVKELLGRDFSLYATFDRDGIVPVANIVMPPEGKYDVNVAMLSGSFASRICVTSDGRVMFDDTASDEHMKHGSRVRIEVVRRVLPS